MALLLPGGHLGGLGGSADGAGGSVEGAWTPPSVDCCNQLHLYHLDSRFLRRNLHRFHIDMASTHGVAQNEWGGKGEDCSRPVFPL